MFPPSIFTSKVWAMDPTKEAEGGRHGINRVKSVWDSNRQEILEEKWMVSNLMVYATPYAIIRAPFGQFGSA